MQWEAFIVIGLFTLGLGILLFVPAWLWVKHKQRTDAAVRAKLRLTRLGWLLICVMVIALIGGYSMQYIVPESLLGQFVKTPGGRFLYLVIVALIFWLIEAALKTRGIQLIKKEQANTDG